MKKHELIALLAQYPDDMDVYVLGYEGGFDVPEVMIERVGPKANDDPYTGAFDRDKNAPEAIVIGG